MNLQNLTTTDLLIAFFSGVGATVIGFLLTMFWEWRKTRKQETTVADTLIHELTTNKETLDSNLKLINQELVLLDQDKSIIIPLGLLSTDFTSLLVIGTPKKYRQSPQIIMDIRKLSRAYEESNETIRSRETYRVNNGAMSDYKSRLEVYDQILQTQTNGLIKLTNDLLPNL